MASILPSNQGATIKVIGVGGAGCTAVNGIILAGLRHECIAVDADTAELTRSQAPVRIRIGGALTQRPLEPGASNVAGQAVLRILGRIQPRGASTVSGGRKAAEEAREELRDALQGADLVFVVAGMGGGIGTGAAPVVAQIARNLGAFTIGVVTEPGTFEGRQHLQIAGKGMATLRGNVDTLITLPCDRLLHLGDQKMTLATVADDMIRIGVLGIAAAITTPGPVHWGIAEVRSLLATEGKAGIGVGHASGPDRAAEAARRAVHSPLLNGVIPHAHSVLFTFAGAQYTPFELANAAAAITEAAGPGTSMCLGAVLDHSLGADVQVLVLAMGVRDMPTSGWDRPQPPSGRPPSGPPPSDQRIPRRPPLSPLAGSAQAVPPSSGPQEVDAVGSIVVPWLPDRSGSGGVSPLQPT
jgi:cell division protein FtsZ